MRINLIRCYSSTSVSGRKIWRTINILIVFLLIINSSCSSDVTAEPSVSIAEYYNTIDSTIITLQKDSAISYLEDRLSDRPMQPVDSAEVYYNLYKGQLMMMEKQFNEAIPYLVRAEREAQSFNMNEIQLKSGRYLGASYIDIRKLDSAITILRKAIDITPLKHPNVLDEAYYQLARVYYVLHPSKAEASFYLNKALDVAKTNNDQNKIARYHHLMSTLYYARFQNAESDSCLALAFNYYDNPEHLLNNVPNQEYSFFLCQSLATSYLNGKQYNKARSTFRDVFKLSEKYDMNGSNSIASIAQTYVSEQLPCSTDSIIHYYKRYFKYLETKNYPINRGAFNVAYRTLSKLYLKEKMYDEGFHLNNKYLAFTEDFYRKDLERSVIEMDKRYDMNIKEQEVKQLNFEIHRTEQRLWTIIIIFVLCSLVASLLIFSYSNKKKYKQELEQVQYEQRLLRSQMTPHLILNTITSIQHYIRLNENKMANKYLVKFSRLLQATLENSAKSFVSINKEIEALYNYLDLQKMRFGELFTYEIRSDFDLEDDFIFIPPMIIQPFVENSINHGFQGMKDGGKIKISLLKKEGYLHCTIEDNGIGLREEDEISDRDRESMSGEITNNRLKLFGKQLNVPSGVEIVNKVTEFNESGVRIEIQIPIKSTICTE